MKKVFTLILSMLAFFSVSSFAQRSWEQISPMSVKEIIEGEAHYYALQAGYSDKNPSDFGYWSINEVRSASIETHCVFHFIAVDEKKVGDQIFKIYVLKSVADGKYLTKDVEKYTANIEKAYRFTARIGRLYEGIDPYTVDWITYSNYLNFQVDVDAGAWVLCNPESQEYVGFYNNPSFLKYTRTNHWYIYEVKECALSEKEKLTETFAQYFKGQDVNTELYPVGDEVGCIDSDMYGELMSVYSEASSMLGVDGLPDEEYKRVNEAIVATFEKYQQRVKKLVSGYYLIVNKGRNGLCFSGDRDIWVSKDQTAPQTWTVDDAKNIWRVYQNGDNRCFIQNWISEKFIGQAGDGIDNMKFPLVADSTEFFTVDKESGFWHYIYDGHGHKMKCSTTGYIRHWNSVSDLSKFRFISVDLDTIARLVPLVEQDRMNKLLTALVKESKDAFFGKSNNCGLTYDGKYLSEAKGLVTEVQANSFYKNNRPENAFDSDVNTYFHSDWSHTEGNREDFHWIQMDLGKEVAEVVIKFSDRGNSPYVNVPRELAIVAAPKGSSLSLDESWTDTIANHVKAIATYSTKYANGVKDSTTYIGKVKLSKPAQHIRVVVTQTAANNHRPLNPSGKAVTYNISEFRIYDAADCVDNPRFAMIPEEIKAALNVALLKAEDELETKKATQAVYDELQAAYDAFMAAYPDPTELLAQLADAQNLVDVSVEMDPDAEAGVQQVGFFKSGAIETFGNAIADFRAEVENKVMTVEEIKAAQKKLEVAYEAFCAELIVPEPGKVYRIVSAAGSNENNEELKQNNSLVAAVNADINATPVWGYNIFSDVNLDNRFNTLWLLEKTSSGYTFRNLSNGYYMNNSYETENAEDGDLSADNDQRIGYSLLPKHFTFEPAYEAGTVRVALKHGVYLNSSRNGNMVRHEDGKNLACKYKFVEATDDNVQEYAISTKPGAVQILSLPIDVAMVYSDAHENALKVLGVKDNKIRLAYYNEWETIKAGTPFIVMTQREDASVENSFNEDYVTAQLTVSTLKECCNLIYNYDVVSQNGMVSAPSALVLSSGFGYIFNNKVIISEGGETIDAGSGFFEKGLPVTAEEGLTDCYIDLTGEIAGDATGLSDLKVVENKKVNVYTISGSLVRKNMERAMATKGLAKGVYVVGNEKVVIK